MRKLICFLSADYPQWEVQRQKKAPPAEYMPPTTPFEGNSRYKSDFPIHGRTPRESFKPVENTIRSDAPFEGMTEARKSYVHHAAGLPEVLATPGWFTRSTGQYRPSKSIYRKYWPLLRRTTGSTSHSKSICGKYGTPKSV